MFVQSAAFVEHHRESVNEISVYGQEKVAETIRLCKMNLAVHGLSGDIRQSVTYYEDPHKSVGKFDFVMANPPFNVDKVDKERIKDDPRYHFVSDLRTASCVSCFVAAFLSNETVEGRRSGTVAWSCIGAGSERQECGIFLS